MHQVSAEQQRHDMVVTQLIGRGIRDPRVLAAMRVVPREEFFPAQMRRFAYRDGAFSIGEGQTISQPYMVARMTECLELEGAQKVLEVGTGSGYQAAVLAEMGAEVYSIERIPVLAERAQGLLGRLGYASVRIVAGDGTHGWKAHAPYDRIIVTAGARAVPPELLDQLSSRKGVLVIPVGTRSMQVLRIVRKDGETLSEHEECPCTFVPFIGEYEYQ